MVWFGKQAKGVLRHVDGSYIKLHQQGLQGSKLKREKQAIGPPSLHYRMNEEALSRRAVSRLRVSLLNMSAFSAQAQNCGRNQIRAQFFVDKPGEVEVKGAAHETNVILNECDDGSDKAAGVQAWERKPGV